MAERQHRETVTSPPARGTIFDPTGVQLAIGEQTTTVYADPRQIERAARVAVAAHRLLGVDANALYPQLLNKKTSFVYIQRFADPKAAASSSKRASPASTVPGGEARLSAGHGRRRRCVGYAGTDNKGLGGLEVAVRQALCRQAGQADDRPRSVRPRDRHRSARPPSGRARDVFTTIDHTIQANAEAVLRADRRALGREGGDRGRARPAHGRGARDGAGAGLRREQGEHGVRSRCSATARSPTRSSRARRSSS